MKIGEEIGLFGCRGHGGRWCHLREDAGIRIFVEIEEFAGWRSGLGDLLFSAKFIEHIIHILDFIAIGTELT